MLSGIKKVVKRMLGDKEQLAEDKKIAKLERWQKKLTEAMSEHDAFRAATSRWDAQYNGTKEVSPAKVYMSNRTDAGGTQDARQVVNITLQLVESQIDVSVPKPAVSPVEPDDEHRRKMIEGMLEYMSEGPELERIVSENERIVKKNSLAVYKVSYDPDHKAHKWRGRIKTTNPHPVNVIPQPGVYRVENMDYLFHIENRTIDYICRTYGEEFREQLEEESPEYGHLETFGVDYTSTDKGKLSVVECWYKDKEGDVCLITWANEVILRDIPKFFYKRDESGEIVTHEVIDIPIFSETGEQIGSEDVLVPVHVPKRFPFVIQYNIPKEKSFYGKSDPEIIFDQQESIKKVLSIEEEKQVKGTTKIFVRKGTGIASKLTDAVTQVIETDNPSNDVMVVDLKTPDRALENYYRMMVQAAKDTLGITEASQGRTDQGSTLSGRALEILANNTAGRLSTKIFEKQLAFKELYRLYYDFILAFYDDPRPYRIDGPDNKPQFGYFDKSLMVKQDDAGDYYYPEMDIYITTDSGLPKDKRFIMDSAHNALGSGATDPIGFWTVMESIGFPNATALLEREQEKEQMAMQQAQMQGGPPMGGQPNPVEQLIQSMPPEQQEMFLNLPPEEQEAMVNQVMGGM